MNGRHLALIMFVFVWLLCARMSDGSQETRAGQEGVSQAAKDADLPGDWQKTPVGKDGGLQYDPRGPGSFGTRIVPGVAGGMTKHVRQESTLPREAYALTVGKRYELECVIEAFAVPAPETAAPQALLVERIGTDSVLAGWAAPSVPCDPAFADIAVGWHEPIRYRIKVEGTAGYEFVFGLCEGHHTGSGQRVLDLQIEGKTRRTVDVIAEKGRNLPVGYAFEAADENGDGWLDVAVVSAANSPDDNTILNVLWVFAAGQRPPVDEVHAGRHNHAALAYVPCGSGTPLPPRDDILILRLRSPQSLDVTAVPTLTIESNQRVETAPDHKSARIGSRTAVLCTEPFTRVDKSPGRTALVFPDVKVPAGGERVLLFGVHRGPGEGEAPATLEEAQALRRRATATAPQLRQALAERLKAFCIDFNWGPGGENAFAGPGVWADASPEEHVKWYEALGANVIQTFAVSCNGYAWYKGGVVPEQPGLRHDFLTEVVRLGHQRNMKVMGYFCIGANTRWGRLHPDLSYGIPATPHIPFTDQYLDYLCGAIQDALEKTGMDGFMIDWIWHPNGEPTMNTDPRGDAAAGRWLEAEKRLFADVMGRPFPGEDQLSPADKLEYDGRATQRCWRRIYEAAKRTRPDCIIWLSCHNLKAPSLEGCSVFQEVDWLMNENPDPEGLEYARLKAGPPVQLVQCLVGWGDQHDARRFLSGAVPPDLAIYGFAKPHDDSLPLPIETYLSRPAESFHGNDRNIAVLARYFNGVPLDAVREPVPKRRAGAPGGATERAFAAGSVRGRRLSCIVPDREVECLFEDVRTKRACHATHECSDSARCAACAWSGPEKKPRLRLSLTKDPHPITTLQRLGLSEVN